MPIFKTDREFSEYVGVTPASIGHARRNGKLTKTAEGYDTKDPKNHEYAVGLTTKAMAQRGIIVEPKEKSKADGLEAEKMRADILLKKKQARKLDTAHSKDIKDLIPSSLMAVWIGYFTQGIRTNFLVIGNRIARGDTELMYRIEKEVKKAIEKTIDGAAQGLQNEGPAILEAFEEKK